jgi:hypothetical protein
MNAPARLTEDFFIAATTGAKTDGLYAQCPIPHTADLYQTSVILLRIHSDARPRDQSHLGQEVDFFYLDLCFQPLCVPLP